MLAKVIIKEVPLLGKGRVAIIGLFALLALLGIRDSFALAVRQAITLPLFIEGVRL